MVGASQEYRACPAIEGPDWTEGSVRVWDTEKIGKCSGGNVGGIA